MLILSRVLNEGLELTIPAGTVFTDDAKITVTVVKVGRQIKIGIDAPNCVRILRDELLGRGVDMIVADPPYAKPEGRAS
jgi:carbon storage regulator CsrA